MAKAETNISHQIMQDLAPICTLFKNVRGFFWTLDKKRKVRAGLLAPGASDDIGITPIRITPEMVGRVVGVFTAFEIKTDSGTPSDDQLKFCEIIRSKGGIAGICRSPEQAKKLISDFQK